MPRPLLVLGADGCPGNGWVVAAVDIAGGRPLVWHWAQGAEQLLALAVRLGAAALAADVPIGLPDAGIRRCDALARQRLRGGGASSVFAAPVRGVLDHLTYGSARAAHPSLSAQTFGLVARIADVDAVLRAGGPDVHRTVVECHPEVTLRAVTGAVLPRKKSAPGALQRLRALEAVLGPLPTDAPPGAALDDALDAAACAWTAARWARGQAEVLGGDTDATGVPMRIVV